MRRLSRIGLVMLVSFGIVVAVIAGYVLSIHLFRIGVYALTFYGVATVIHFVLQMLFAYRARSRWNDIQEHPTVRVVIPTYRENPDLLRASLKSVARQRGAVTKLVLSNDDKKDTYVKDIFDEVVATELVCQSGQVWEYRSNGHSGKRRAMYNGAYDTEEEIVVFMDSDSVIMTPSSIELLVQPFAHSEVGCTTGDVTVLNRKDNLLTWVTNLRYWLAFNLERAAQSNFGAMTCVSGPFGAYRTTVLKKVLDRWLNQMFMGNICTYGDDRHLTNLVLREGYRAVFVPGAKAETEAPRRVDRWLLQQLRWSRSFFREYIVNIRSFTSQSPWLAYDLTYQAFFPGFVLTNLTIISYLAITKSIAHLIVWLGIVGMFGMFRAMYGAIMTKNPAFLVFILYGYLYAILLLPMRVYAFATCFKTNWEARPTHFDPSHL